MEAHRGLRRVGGPDRLHTRDVPEEACTRYPLRWLRGATKGCDRVVSGTPLFRASDRRWGPRACRPSLDVMRPAAALPHTVSNLWIPATLHNVTSSPVTESFVAPEMPPALANTLPQTSHPASMPDGGAQSPMEADVSTFSLSPKSPLSDGALMQQRPTMPVSNSLSHLPVHSPMHNFLSRDQQDFSVGNAVTVGEPVTKLSALAASVQGWRTTQEDAEAVFLVDIPAISEEVVNRKELREVAAAAAAVVEASAEKPLETPHDGNLHRQDSSLIVDGSCKLSAPSAFESSPELCAALRPSNSAVHERPNTGGEKAAASPTGASKEEMEAAPKETMPMAVFCMFDGHGGDAVAKLAARHFEAHLRRAIEETRPGDVRARALLFFLKAETDSAAATSATAPWLLPSMTAVPTGDGAFNCLAKITPSMASPTGPAVSSPLASADVATGRMPYSHLSSPFQRPSCSANLSIPLDHYSAKRSEQNDDESPSPTKTADTPFTLADELRNASAAGSLSVLVPITAESLRLHTAGATLGLGDAGVKETLPAVEGATGAVGGKNRPSASTRADAATTNNRVNNPHSSNRNRKCGATLDAWEAMEEPLPEVLSVAAGVASPLAGVLLPRSIAAAEELLHGSSSSHTPNPPAGSVAICPSPGAVVSIPEMEMLRQYFASIMEDALLSLDDYLRSTPEGVRGDYNCVGCTACVVGITANFVLCANIGDSGAAFYTKDRMKVISVKHRVSDEAEQSRIHAAGYNISNGRIEGMSAVPRALGDFDFKQCGGRGPRKQAVCAVPDVTIMPVPSDTDQWGIVLACDGVWDTATLHQVHVALTNTVNDLFVSDSATDAVLRGAELYENRLRGPSVLVGRSSWSFSPASPSRSGSPLHSSEALSNSRKTPSPIKGGSFALRPVTEDSMIRYYDDDDDDDASRRLSQVDAILLTAAAGVFAQCVAPEDNDEGVGLDNCSLIIIERRSVQE
ncbi:hypothetical protein, conserved [Leishmania tarentolae]|uniref:PPM-type phosphatase domain-containing protein n=1 Tax=Leishmania tarentolae TaxID=5689 RepID=A0A640KN25_LEITA|nr:hypothetical protein, conserved [Leishmania tarentolae]